MALNKRFGALLKRGVLGVLPLLMAVLLGAAPAQAADGWSLKDQAGHRLSAQIFEQPFPDYASGLRIRLNAIDTQTSLDHSADLLLSDSIGQEWSLPNRSEEIVPRDGSAVPSGSAQFDLDALMPRPSEALPLHLTVTGTKATLNFDLSPEQVMELHAMGSVPRRSDQS
ncbi:DUF3122 domain-containing protein [Synechococcus sp. CS-1324]|uniref:DUF3122 domain-containing protein n=1 Tax=Synechococcus sp. CS-1324 TaxID=2847980 RepID=UPI000DB0B980|nr:DUF3122 domain-containing protein [Synechococcus sp. CS-1324]MCT0229999.1 DUF3122 domain-containing protein [Synechococcus sp. CS-1324]PZV05569.1 MAG: hypothetical protein DCF23_02810 [Cyanobium sp.]